MNLIAGLIPLLASKVAAIPLATKQYHAGKLSELLLWYLEGDRISFELALKDLPIEESTKQAVSNALWADTKGGGTT